MARFDDGINGPFRGKVGSVIGSKWRKVNYMKGLSKKKKRPASPEQAVIRTKFSLLNRFLKPLSKTLEISFRQFTAEATGRNVAFSYNYDEAFIEEEGEVRLNYPALRFSHGSLVTAGAERAWVDDRGVVHITWNTKTYGMGGSPDDEAHMLLFDETNDIFLTPSGTTVRQDGKAEITRKDFLESAREQLHLWLFFTDNDKKRVSKTVYIPIEDAPES